MDKNDLLEMELNVLRQKVAAYDQLFQLHGAHNMIRQQQQIMDQIEAAAAKESDHAENDE